MSTGFSMQEMMTRAENVPENPIKNQQDSTIQKNIVLPVKAAGKVKILQTPVMTDTTSVCVRNPISDISFNDSLNFITENRLLSVNQFPLRFIEKNREQDKQAREVLMKSLKSGYLIPDQPFHSDWILVVVILSAAIYTLVRATSKGIINEVGRFFLFRGINDPASRDIGGLFNWQATLLNLVTFFNIGLFVYFAAVWFDAVPSQVPAILAWLVSVGLIIILVTSRHFVIVVTGSMSNQNEIFREYLLGVYQSYRLSGMILFVIVILVSYTNTIPEDYLIYSGLIVFLLMYSIRVLRLLLIFLNRNVSIFYLILYLCALEILPVLVLLKYSAGLF